jgi:aspartate dehydrogenase
MRVGLIGYGTIARRLKDFLRPDDAIDIVGAVVRDPSKPRLNAPPVFTSVAELLATRPTVVVEVGGHQALRQHGPAVLAAGIDLIFVSVGAMADRACEKAIVDAARAGHSHAIVASGAIGGLDALASAAAGGLSEVIHLTRKPPASLLPADEAASLTEPREVFRGSAREGALLFPENINVAAAVSLAGMGLDRTQVSVVADPAVDRNTHRVTASGAFGDLRFDIENIPEPDNPKTGRLVAMSIAHCLRRIGSPLVVG